MTEPVLDRLALHPSNQRLRYVAAAVAYIVAGMHLFHPELGFAELVVRLSINPELLVADPRPAAFVLSGVAIIVGVTIALSGFPKRPLYSLGMVLMVAYITGYFAWHLSGHGGFLPGRKPLYHGIQPHEAVITHLTGNPLAATAILAETVLLGVLALLYHRDL